MDNLCGCGDLGQVENYSNSECVPALFRAPESFSTDGEYILQSGIKTAKITGASVGLDSLLNPIMTIEAAGLGGSRRYGFDINMNENVELAQRVKNNFILTQIK